MAKDNFLAVFSTLFTAVIHVGLDGQMGIPFAVSEVGFA
jgi:hypothetical protein